MLIPQLAGRAAAATQELRDACLRAVGSLAEVGGPWMAIGTHDDELQLGPTASGSWQPYGADVQVALGPDAANPAALPLPALVAGWLRGCAAPAASIRMQLYRGDTTPEGCVQHGHALADDPSPQALLVLGDGCTTLTEKAPGAYDARAAAVQEQIDRALSTVDRAALGGLDPQLCRELGVSGRVPWQVAAAAVGAGWHGESLHHSAPYGVGYQVAVWRR